MSQGPSPLALIDRLALPTLPSVVQRMNSLLADPDVGTREIGAVLANDPAMAAQVLRIANSASMGLRERVLSTEHAAAVLGMRALRNIALQASVIGQYDHLEGGAFDLRRLWKHSILVAQLCQSLASVCSGDLELAPEEFYTVGLLHDLGQVVLLEAVPDDFLECVAASRRDDKPLHELEEAAFGFGHAELGARIAMRWSLPGTMVSAIQFHHGPEEEVQAEPAVALVELANRVADAASQGSQPAALACLDRERAELLGIDPKGFFAAVQQAIEAWPTIEV